jgi:hypothetical protein
MGFYTTLYLISKLFTGGKKAAPEAGKSNKNIFIFCYMSGCL